FFRVVRAGGVAGGGADAGVFFLDQFFVAQLLVALVAPEFLAHAQMQVFGKGFRQSVGQGLDHNAVVIVAGVLVLPGQFFRAYACGDHKAADVILFAAVLGCDKVGQGVVGFGVARLLLLLTDMVQGFDLLARIVVHSNVVVVDGVGGPEADNAAGLDQFFVDKFAQHFLRVRKQIARGFTHHFVVQYARVFAGQVPGDKKRCPVQKGHQLFQRVVVQYFGANKFRRWWRVVVPVGLEAVFDGLRIG